MADKRERGLSQQEQELRIRERDIAAVEAILRSPTSTFPSLGAYVDFLQDAVEALVTQARGDIQRLREHEVVSPEPARGPADRQLDLWWDVYESCLQEQSAAGGCDEHGKEVHHA